MRTPPSRGEWLRDGVQRGGHSVAESIQYLSLCSDWDDVQAQQRALPANVVTVDAERPWLTALRRWLRR